MVNLTVYIICVIIVWRKGQLEYAVLLMPGLLEPLNKLFCPSMPEIFPGCFYMPGWVTTNERYILSFSGETQFCGEMKISEKTSVLWINRINDRMEHKISHTEVIKTLSYFL